MIITFQLVKILKNTQSAYWQDGIKIEKNNTINYLIT